MITSCCRRCSLWNVLAILLAAAIPWCHAFCSLQHAALLLPTHAVCSSRVLVAASKDPTNNINKGSSSSGSTSWSSTGNAGQRDYTHHRRSPQRNNNKSIQDGDLMSQAQMEFLMNDIQSPPTSASSSSSTSPPKASNPPTSSNDTTEKKDTKAAVKNPLFSSNNNDNKQDIKLPSQKSSPDETLVTTVPFISPKEKASLIQMDRAAFRMDGLEVYAVVSALTLASSIQFFELLSKHWTMAAQSTTSMWTMGLDLICIAASAVGMITGLHSTFVFSLMTVYGRTAVGMGWDQSFARFFEKTEAVRSRAFRSFRISLYTFLVQILFLIVWQLPPSRILRKLGAGIMAAVMWKVVYGDTKLIMDMARVMLFEGRSKEEKMLQKQQGDTTQS
ncbi:expressed unknown protein [Seminavis robusta]|uniref:Transmembrane protein n=1 Tax=Seminavis robusta TaxID=568900 RepID=A0A9N8EGM3_9STRA|nr:expressed unknown protein [Seminavis robusta]|eukprot:Sro1064_g237270.1 n/a (389) ;mRNA; f:28597-29763